MRRWLQILAIALGTAGGLGACSPGPAGWSELEQPGPKRPTASASLEVHLVSFEPDSAELAPDQEQGLRRFLQDHGANTRDPLVVMTHRAMRASLSRARRENVAEFLKRAGFRDVETRTPDQLDAAWDAGRRARAVLVQLLHYEAASPACPDFRRPYMGGFGNLTSSNFGCATAQNLGAMVAEPRDLVDGREPGPADGKRMGDSIERYRTDDVKFGSDGEAASTTGQ